MPKASRKTPLKKAPMRRALCQPKERSWRAVAFSEIWKVSVKSLGFRDMGLTIWADSATMKLTRSFSYRVVSIDIHTETRSSISHSGMHQPRVPMSEFGRRLGDKG